METIRNMKKRIRNQIEDRMKRHNHIYEDVATITSFSRGTIWNAVNAPHKVKAETMEEIWISYKK